MAVVTDINELSFSGLYTYKDYLSWRFKERVELIKGRLFKMTPAPSSFHQSISIALSSQLWFHFKETECKVFEAPFDVRLDPAKEDKIYTVVQPDLCIICDKDKIDERGCNGAPDLIVEIISPGNSSKEMREKFEIYEESGVREYWLINPLDKNVIVYSLNDENAFIAKKPFIESDQLRSEIFVDLTIDLSTLFKA
ncbi:MAG: Uma2 family endonuclease [Bacteroidota bacterium]